MTDYCICGAYLEDVMASANAELAPEDRSRAVWRHVPGSDTRCTGPRRTADVLPDRQLAEATAEQMAGLISRTRRASGELETAQSMLAELAEEVSALRNVLDQPATIRRNTLLEVWDKLMTSGNLTGARLVRDMIQGL